MACRAAAARRLSSGALSGGWLVARSAAPSRCGAAGPAAAKRPAQGFARVLDGLHVTVHIQILQLNLSVRHGRCEFVLRRGMIPWLVLPTQLHLLQALLPRHRAAKQNLRSMRDWAADLACRLRRVGRDARRQEALYANRGRVQAVELSVARRGAHAAHARTRVVPVKVCSWGKEAWIDIAATSLRGL